MKCPMCLGKGYATDEDIKEYPHRCPSCDGKGFYRVDWQKVRCEVCNGSGKKPMTNEEYLRSCNTEELAIFICNNLPQETEGTLENRFWSALYSQYPIEPMNAYHEVMKWLKEEHI